MTNDSLLNIELSRIEGVPLLRIPRVGRTIAGITFGVGRADEPLPQAGINHLIEHLALFDLDDKYSIDGMVDLNTTNFLMRGNTTEAANFLRDVCANLANLPFDRLAGERDVLTAESANRQRGLLQHILMLRHGARGPGAANFDEFGLEYLDESALMAWRDEFFHKQNAVIWVVGDIDDFHISLPEGSSRERTAVPMINQPTPALQDGPSDGLAISLIVPRNAASNAASRLLERYLTRRLRRDLAATYDVDVTWLPLDRDTATIIVVADVLETKSSDASCGLLEVLHNMCDEEFAGASLAEIKREFVNYMSDGENALSLITSAAENVSLGFSQNELAFSTDDVANLTATDIADIFRAANESLIAILPSTYTNDTKQFAPIVNSAHPPVTGKKFKTHVGALEHKNVLTIGDAGVTIEWASGEKVTVMYDDLAVMVKMPNNDRVLIGNDASQVTILNAFYSDDDIKTITYRVDSAVAPELVAIRSEAILPMHATSRTFAASSAAVALIPGVVAAVLMWNFHWLIYPALGLVPMSVGLAIWVYRYMRSEN